MMYSQYRSRSLPESPLKRGKNMIGHLQSYNYSGITLDAEMSMKLFVPHLYDIIQIRLFNLL